MISIVSIWDGVTDLFCDVYLWWLTNTGNWCIYFPVSYFYSSLKKCVEERNVKNKLGSQSFAQSQCCCSLCVALNKTPPSLSSEMRVEESQKPSSKIQVSVTTEFQVTQKIKILNIFIHLD